MPDTIPLNTQKTLGELLQDMNPNIYRHAIAILQQLNKQTIEQQQKNKIRAMNSTSDTP